MISTKFAVTVTESRLNTGGEDVGLGPVTDWVTLIFLSHAAETMRMAQSTANETFLNMTHSF
ncbi:MAG: hypothetical protein A3J09_00650 [Candidatus Zambryskibacteria bacterium RIFCSPLOWO2_02_FULL_51_21]|uniref:Uncharacterized protein n=1 Tax=Candidatus Zambryskibacteria bacterium RIFCSPHIGHO2_02_FULL_43_37 TaxID=1802749 RepID=A0A1G2TJB9_9BACT|nr:MAG: hypothetical protein A3D49_02610 [Candidatus Zambryskibacteria bacterium RIFCSPHIGHO2_02_FULL_43_37]OHB11066.1 MAG: hypothetical protein A3J09_00650 [Candidatus Zambryskibacteria bacterium RIFCSPLOWO2_02_FULL_51_21]